MDKQVSGELRLSKIDCIKALDMFNGDHKQAYEFIINELNKEMPFAEYGKLFRYARNNTTEKRAEHVAKVWLSRAHKISQRIARVEENITFWYELATRCTSNPSQVLGQMSTGKRLEDNVVKIQEAIYENEIRLSEMIVIKREVEFVINFIKDPICQELLHKRYICLSCWATIADEMRMSESHVRQKLHSQALSYAKTAIDIYNDTPSLREHWENPIPTFEEWLEQQITVEGDL